MLPKTGGLPRATLMVDIRRPLELVVADVHPPLDGSVGSKSLLLVIRGELIARGTTLTSWCAKSGISRQYATLVLLGKRNGPKARELRSRLIAEIQ